MTDLAGYEAALFGHETQVLGTVDWRRIERRARALARRPYWAFAWLLALAAGNLAIGLAPGGRPWSIGIGIGLVLIAFGRLEKLKATRERLAALGDTRDSLLEGYRKDLRVASATKFVRCLVSIGIAILFGILALVGKYPAAAGTVALVFVALAIWNAWRFCRLAVEVHRAGQLDG